MGALYTESFFFIIFEGLSLKKYETKRLKLYFSKYKNEDSLKSKFIRISPTKDAMSYYDFKEKLIEIR